MPILGPCAQIGTKNEFPRKNPLSFFQYLNYLPLCQKIWKKAIEPFLRKFSEGHTKNQFISLISLWDTANSRVLQLIEKSCNLIGQQHFGPMLAEPELWNLNQNYEFTRHNAIVISCDEQMQISSFSWFEHFPVKVNDVTIKI